MKSSNLNVQVFNEYSKIYDNLDGAMKIYQEVRNDYFKELDELITDQIGKAHLSIARPYGDYEGDDFKEWYISGLYYKKRKSIWSSAMGMQFYNDLKEFGYSIYTCFHSSGLITGEIEQITQEIKEKIEDVCYMKIGKYHYYYQTITPHDMGNYNIAGFKRIAKQLPSLFKKCDQIVAKHCE